MTSQRAEMSLSFNSVTSGSSATLVIQTPDIAPIRHTDDGFNFFTEGNHSTAEIPKPGQELQAEERATTRYQISPSLLLDHVSENENANEFEERADNWGSGLHSDHRRDDENQHDESFLNSQTSVAQTQNRIEDNVISGTSADAISETKPVDSRAFDMDRFLRGEYDDKQNQHPQSSIEAIKEPLNSKLEISDEYAEDGDDDQKVEDKTEAEEDVSPPETPELPAAVIEIPADLRSRSPNIANLIQKRKSSLVAPAMKSPAASFTPTPVDRSTTSTTSVGVFINGKLSGHSEQRSILTSHYLAINSLGVLSYFHYRLRATELADCVAVLANGEIIIADNHSDIRRLKFFDGNQRYQRSLPLVPEFKEFESPPYVTDIQLSDQDTRLWICDCFNQTIREIDLASGHTYQLWENDRLERGQKLLRPGKVAITPERVYICDAGDQSVKAFQRNSGNYLFQFKVGLKDAADENGFSQALRCYGSVLDDHCGCPWSIHWTMDETLLVGDIRYDFVYIVDERGKQLGKFGGNGKGPNKFNGPVSICSDGDGNVAIADAKNGRVHIFTRDMMSITQVYPVDDCEEVSSLALTSDGMLTVIDHLNNLCLIF